MSLKSIHPTEAARLAADDRVLIVDIREPDEFAAARIAGAVSRPLSRFRGPVSADAGKAIVFTCKSGKRTAMNSALLARLATCEAYVLEGGLDGWAACGLPVV